MKEAAYALHKVAGLGFDQISNLLNISKSNVYYNMKNDNRNKRNKTKKIKENEVEFIENLILDKPSTSLNEMIKSLKEKYNKKVGKETIRRMLKERGFKNIFAKNTPNLNQNHIDIRKSYCSNNLNYFNDIVFIDESTFKLDENNVRVWTKAKNKASNEKEMINERSNKGNVKVNVLAGITSGVGKIFMKIFRGNMDQYQFLYLLSDELIPKINSELGEDFKLQMDNASYHYGHSVKEFIEDENVRIVYQPPKSPDLNPIERVWSYLKFEVNQEKPRSQEQLEEVIQRKWNEMRDKTIKVFVCKHYEIVNKIHEKKGGNNTEE